MFKGKRVWGNLSLLLILVNFSAVGKAVAQTKTTKKFAVVDMQSIIMNVAEGKAAKTALEAEIKEKEAKLAAQKKELEEINKSWQAQAPLLSEDARMKKQQEFQEKFVSLRNQEMAFQNEIKQKEQKATSKIAMSVTQIVDKISAERGYDMVFETSSAGLLYLREPDDLTKEVIAAYDKQGPKTSAKK